MLVFFRTFWTFWRKLFNTQKNFAKRVKCKILNFFQRLVDFEIGCNKSYRFEKIWTNFDQRLECASAICVKLKTPRFQLTMSFDANFWLLIVKGFTTNNPAYLYLIPTHFRRENMEKQTMSILQFLKIGYKILAN